MLQRVAVLCVLVAVLCGLVPVLGVAQERERSPTLMGLFSFVIPGLGQFLQEDTEKALTHLLIAVVIPVAGAYLALVSPAPAIVSTVTVVAQLGWAIYSAVDSYEMAVAYNEEHGFSPRAGGMRP